MYVICLKILCVIFFSLSKSSEIKKIWLIKFQPRPFLFGVPPLDIVRCLMAITSEAEKQCHCVYAVRGLLGYVYAPSLLLHLPTYLRNISRIMNVRVQGQEFKTRRQKQVLPLLLLFCFNDNSCMFQMQLATLFYLLRLVGNGRRRK